MALQLQNMHVSKLKPALILLLLGMALSVLAETTNEQPAGFVAAAFDGAAPDAKLLWIGKSLRKDIEGILGHEPAALRIRYWQRANRSVWILDEIGKDLPITTGIVVHDGAIESLRVLVFRESRGWEVRHPFFTDQFNSVRLTSDYMLDHQIDGITGATFSVRTLKKQARLALLLDSHIRMTRVEAQKTPH